MQRDVFTNVEIAFPCDRINAFKSVNIAFNGNVWRVIFPLLTVSYPRRIPNNSKIPIVLLSFVYYRQKIKIKEIVMIDMRYFAGDMDMVAGDADEILFLYELSSFAGDSNISKLGR